MSSVAFLGSYYKAVELDIKTCFLFCVYALLQLCQTHLRCYTCCCFMYPTRRHRVPGGGFATYKAEELEACGTFKGRKLGH